MSTRKVKRRKKPGCMSGSDWTRPRFDDKPVDLADPPKITHRTTPEELLAIALAQAKVRAEENAAIKEAQLLRRRVKKAAVVPATIPPATPAVDVPSSTNPTPTNTTEGN